MTNHVGNLIGQRIKSRATAPCNCPHVRCKANLFYKRRLGFNIFPCGIRVVFSIQNGVFEDWKRQANGGNGRKKSNGTAITAVSRCDISGMATRYQWNGVAIWPESRCDNARIATDPRWLERAGFLQQLDNLHFAKAPNFDVFSVIWILLWVGENGDEIKRLKNSDLT